MPHDQAPSALFDRKARTWMPRDGVAGHDAGSCMACPVCGTNVLVLALRDPAARLFCCGEPLMPARPIRCSAEVQPADEGLGMQEGRLYRDERSGIVVRCTYTGAGLVAVDGRPLVRPPSSRHCLI